MGIFPTLGQNLGKPYLIKKPASPYKIRDCRHLTFFHFLFSQVFPQFSLCSCRFHFCQFTNYIFSSPLSSFSHTFSKKQPLSFLGTYKKSRKNLLPSSPSPHTSILSLSQIPYFQHFQKKKKISGRRKERRGLLPFLLFLPIFSLPSLFPSNHL